MAEIKFCGMTRALDAREAVALDTDYVGMIFAGGPRHQTIASALEILADVPRSTKRVGVVSNQSVAEIAELVAALSLDVIQLHADPSLERLREVRSSRVAVWPVLRVAGSTLPQSFDQIARETGVVVLDAKAPDGLGGSGLALPWMQLAEQLHRVRGDTRIVLAGGLRPENVADAIAALDPDLVDVSSGVECTTGIKDHARMRAFRDAVQRAAVGDSR